MSQIIGPCHLLENIPLFWLYGMSCSSSLTVLYDSQVGHLKPGIEHILLSSAIEQVQHYANYLLLFNIYTPYSYGPAV